VSRTVGEMTEEEFRALVGEVVEEKLAELVHDPDEGLDLGSEFQTRLEMQLEQVRAGERGVPLGDVLRARSGP
jgi:hypothetical protein